MTRTKALPSTRPSSNTPNRVRKGEAAPPPSQKNVIATLYLATSRYLSTLPMYWSGDPRRIGEDGRAKDQQHDQDEGALLVEVQLEHPEPRQSRGGGPATQPEERHCHAVLGHLAVLEHAPDVLER